MAFKSKFNKQNGYSFDTAQKYFDLDKSFISLSPEGDKRKNWVNGEPSDTFHYRYWFVQEGNPPFEVEFDDIQKISQFDEVSFQELEACEVRGKVYFRAKQAKTIKKGE
ncbi:TPA: hypothetical protein U1383_001893 [Streptococcus suis]|uniref:hypothetical protein n=1 Tax=Streptococcus suis TaxID=1307 RepID=UPI00155815DC|nr:hypothetical protein [Streptococcus suis]MCQ8262159.1 hypothetical protein [Streptococcus suis]NQM48186.1 hypothetical protein [Streptococcus suis]HEL2051583.1 hypothetical protein [Streptococcus suis]HEM4070589.1 hypothetical protein [Streptococcus suis]HEM5069990.1 hypothetical protein [Streptococcus suis]